MDLFRTQGLVYLASYFATSIARDRGFEDRQPITHKDLRINLPQDYAFIMGLNGHLARVGKNEELLRTNPPSDEFIEYLMRAGIDIRGVNLLV